MKNQESYFTSGSDRDRFVTSNIVNVASQITACQILDMIVVWWIPNVPSGSISNTLINIIDVHIPNCVWAFTAAAIATTASVLRYLILKT